MKYIDRHDAGRRLAQVLRHFKSKDTVILALPRGGIVLGAEVAKELEAPLGLVLVKKICHPNYPEYAIGAVAEDDPPVYNLNETELMDPYWLKGAERRARDIISHRRDLYYDDDFVPPDIERKTVIIVDDGIATGLTMEVAVRAMRHKNAAKIIVAAPVASVESVDILEDLADEVVILDDPNNFYGAVGNYYLEFEQVDDEEVSTLLREVEHEEQQTASRHPTYF